MGRPRVSIEHRLLSNVEQVTESGCWIWTLALSHNGYGLIGTGNGPKRNHLGRVHRVSYELYRGPIPEGMQLDHLCRVRCCANPWHCEIVDNNTNVMRGVGPTAVNAKKNALQEWSSICPFQEKRAEDLQFLLKRKRNYVNNSYGGQSWN